MSLRTSPLIIGHRGASRLAPENTLAAFSRAIADGADGIELDVRLLRDGALAVFHDSRLNRTTDGRGRIELLRRGDLNSISAGSWFHPRFRSERIPTLDEVFELVDRRIGVNVEIKSDLRSRSSTAIVDRLIAAIRRHRASNIVLLSSFHHRLLAYAASKSPEIPLGYLYHTVTALGRAPLRKTKRGAAAYLIVNGSTCTRRLVRRAHAAGVCIGEYTVNSPRRIGRSLNFGVDAIITDDPARARQTLASLR